MPQVPHVSEAEWAVMEVLWAEGPVAVGRIIEVLSASTEWHANTIKTLVHRLVEKGAVGVSGTPRAYRYAALVSREECVRAENRSFLNRLYGGAVKPMLAAFLREEQLTPEDVEELKRLLDGEG